jgi:hypothetical protein
MLRHVHSVLVSTLSPRARAKEQKSRGFSLSMHDTHPCQLTGGGRKFTTQLTVSSGGVLRRNFLQKAFQHIQKGPLLRVGHRHRQTPTTTSGKEDAIVEGMQEEFIG